MEVPLAISQMNTDLNTDSLFDIVWANYEHNPDTQQESSDVILQQLTINEQALLLTQIHETILKENPSSVRFALLLNFKRAVIDCIVNSWTNAELKTILPLLHQMEILYVMIQLLSVPNSDSLQQCWFYDDLAHAYRLFEYIVKWTHWKVESDSPDECYYETYFHDYGRQERKVVINSLGSDILRFIETHPHVYSIESVIKSLNEIVPLLSEQDHLVLFWRFYQKLLLKDDPEDDHNQEDAKFFQSLSALQVRSIIVLQPPVTNPSLSRRTSALAMTSVCKDADGLVTLTECLLAYIATLYTRSTVDGDEFLNQNGDIFQIDLYPISLTKVDQYSIQPICKILNHTKPDQLTQCLTNVLQSRYVNDQYNMIRTMITQWINHPSLTAKGELACRFLLTDYVDSTKLREYLKNWVDELKDEPLYSNLLSFVEIYKRS
ncbi:hypothetical protein BC833DRAFT_593711 [Globomyces pollinis-pini]|nr:hypothetical protein BC833DRAFT_593711 [Globomyces pollinis-pini]